MNYEKLMMSYEQQQPCLLISCIKNNHRNICDDVIQLL